MKGIGKKCQNVIAHSLKLTLTLAMDPLARASRAAIVRHFSVGACYQVVTSKRIIDGLRRGEKYVLQPLDKSSDPEYGYVFRYLGKQGIHHMFIEICCGWNRTYTDAQLVGKELVEVVEDDVRALRKEL